MTNHIDLSTITLAQGAHDSRESGMCAMEAVALFAGVDHSDHPPCTDSVVASYVRRLNDRMPDDVRQRLIPYIPKLAGTKNGASPVARAMVCTDRAVRVFAVSALRARGLGKEADKLAALAPIVDKKTANAAYAAAASCGVRAAADAAAYAAAAYAANAAADNAVDAAAAYAAAYAAAAGGAAYAAADAADDAAAADAVYAAAGAYDPWADAFTLLDDLIAMGSAVPA